MPGQNSYTLWVVSMLKGGVRKSTTTMMLAFALAARDIDVLVVDADAGTQGVTDWASQVYASGAELPFDVVQWTPALGLVVPFIQAKQRDTQAQTVLVDLGGEQPDVLRQVVMLAKRVISPGGPERGELGRLPATASIVAGTGVPMHVVLTRVPKIGQGAALDARRDLTANGYDVLTTEIPQHRERYADVWGTAVTKPGHYVDLADELLKLEAAA